MVKVTHGPPFPGAPWKQAIPSLVDDTSERGRRPKNSEDPRMEREKQNPSAEERILIALGPHSALLVVLEPVSTPVLKFSSV